MAMKYICFYHDYLEKFELLDDEEAGRVTKAMLNYAVNGEMPELSRVEMAFFSFFRSNIDREREQYEQKCERNRQNIQKRYRKTTTVYDGRQEEEKEENKENHEYNYEYDDDYENENEEENREEGKEEEPFTPPHCMDILSFLKESGMETDLDVIDMFLAHYSGTNWKTRTGKPVKSWKNALVKWIRRQQRYDSGM